MLHYTTGYGLVTGGQNDLLVAQKIANIRLTMQLDELQLFLRGR